MDEYDLCLEASCCTTSPERLAELAVSSESVARGWVASNAATPPSTLESLSMDRALWGHMGCNPSLPTGVFEKILRDGSWEDRFQLAVNVGSPPWVFSALVDEDDCVLYALAENPAVPSDVLGLVVDRASERGGIETAVLALTALVRRPETPASILGPIATGGQPGTAVHVLLWGSDAADLIPMWVALAGNPSLPSRAACVLAVHESHEVRVALAANRRVDQPLIVQLAGDEELAVRLAAIRNPSAPDHLRVIGVLGR